MQMGCLRLRWPPEQGCQNEVACWWETKVHCRQEGMHVLLEAGEGPVSTPVTRLPPACPYLYWVPAVCSTSPRRPRMAQQHRGPTPPGRSLRGARAGCTHCQTTLIKGTDFTKPVVLSLQLIAELEASDPQPWLIIGL